jgi:hypothetical protein
VTMDAKKITANRRQTPIPARIESGERRMHQPGGLPIMTANTNKPTQPVGLGAMTCSRLRPRAKWTRLPGPPGHGMSSVWEHPSGARVHLLGLLRLPDRSHTSPTWADERKFASHQPRRLRWLLTWAESRLSVNEEARHGEGKAQ